MIQLEKLKKIFSIIVFISFLGTSFSVPVFALAEENLYFIHQDHLGSTTVVTDENGEVVSQNRYYPYGSDRLTAGNQKATEKKYTSQRKDQNTGLYYYNARYYDPALATFISPDQTGDALNPYHYANNNPLLYIDPTGNQTVFLTLYEFFFGAFCRPVGERVAPVEEVPEEAEVSATFMGGPKGETEMAAYRLPQDSWSVQDAVAEVTVDAVLGKAMEALAGAGFKLGLKKLAARYGAQEMDEVVKLYSHGEKEAAWKRVWRIARKRNIRWKQAATSKQWKRVASRFGLSRTPGAFYDPSTSTIYLPPAVASGVEAHELTHGLTDVLGGMEAGFVDEIIASGVEYRAGLISFPEWTGGVAWSTAAVGANRELWSSLAGTGAWSLKKTGVLLPAVMREQWMNRKEQENLPYWSFAPLR